MTLSWEPNTEEDLAHYNVYRGEDSDDLTLIDEVPAGTETFLDTEVTNDVTFFYAIDAENEAGERSGRTDVVEATPQADDEDVAPEVVSTSPQNESEDVALNTTIRITFSTSMDEGATEAAFEAEPGIDCAFNWNEDSTRLTCQPEEELEPNTEYTVTIDTGAQDLAGNNLEEAVSFSFTTGEDQLETCVFDESTFNNCVLGQ